MRDFILKKNKSKKKGGGHNKEKHTGLESK